jgi:hypothetical protein
MGTESSDIFSEAAWPADHTKPCPEGFYKKTPRQSLCSEVLSASNCFQTLIKKGSEHIGQISGKHLSNSYKIKRLLFRQVYADGSDCPIPIPISIPIRTRHLNVDRTLQHFISPSLSARPGLTSPVCQSDGSRRGPWDCRGGGTNLKNVCYRPPEK